MKGFLGRHGRTVAILLPLAWLSVFFLLPLLEVLQVSFSEARRGVPPYEPLWGWGPDGFASSFNLGNYRLLVAHWTDYLVPALNSLRLAFFSTLLCLLFAYPVAWWISRSPDRVRLVLLVLVMLPFWTSSLIRMYALIGLLNPNGYINAMLLFLGVVDSPVRMMQTDFSVYMGMLMTYLPLMVLPLYASLVRLDDSLVEAAADLGARGMQVFLTVVLPHSLGGVAAGCLLVFIPAVGEFVVPALLGGPEQLMLGKVLWNEFFRSRDWPVAAALAMVLLTIIALPVAAARYNEGLERGDGR